MASRRRFSSELFPASIRFSGVSISYALGAVLGGAFSPTIATALVQATGSTTSVAIYLAIMTRSHSSLHFFFEIALAHPWGPITRKSRPKGDSRNEVGFVPVN